MSHILNLRVGHGGIKKSLNTGAVVEAAFLVCSLQEIFEVVLKSGPTLIGRRAARLLTNIPRQPCVTPNCGESRVSKNCRALSTYTFHFS